MQVQLCMNLNKSKYFLADAFWNSSSISVKQEVFQSFFFFF